MRGLIINPAMRFTLGNIIHGCADPQLTRYYTLLWDEIQIPELSRHLESSLEPDLEYLESCNVVRKYKSPRTGGEFKNQFLGARDDLFTLCEQASPGCWAIADEPEMWPNTVQSNARALQVKLLRALPVPDVDVPLADILEFKRRRKDEFDDLILAINAIYQQILSSPDRPLAESDAILRLVSAAKAVVSVTEERAFKHTMMDIAADFNILGAGAAAFIAFNSSSELLAVAGNSVLAGASLSVKTVLGMLTPKRDNSPFRYVGSYHKELFFK